MSESTIPFEYAGDIDVDAKVIHVKDAFGLIDDSSRWSERFKEQYDKAARLEEATAGFANEIVEAQVLLTGWFLVPMREGETLTDYIRRLKPR